jgi:hypothetical protein
VLLGGAIVIVPHELTELRHRSAGFIILFIGYLVFALFSAAPPHEESAP